MKVAVLGGTGMIGSRLKELLRADWHDVVVASPSTGVDAVTGEGLAHALAGAEVVYDVCDVRSWQDEAASAFFETSSRRALGLELANRTWHHVTLSVVGADRMVGIGYMRAKVAQERVVRDSGQPYTIVRATQTFEGAAAFARLVAEGDVIRLPSIPVQPIAADDVAAALAALAGAHPRHGIASIAGPELMPLHQFVERAHATPAGMRVVRDESAPYLGARLRTTDLVPEPGAGLGTTTLAQWLRDASTTE